MIRVTSQSSYELLRNNFMEIQGEYFKRQVQASTGRRFMNRSEDLANASEAARVARNREDTLQFQDNVTKASAQVIATDKNLQDLVELMQKASELTTIAGNGTHPPEHRMAIATELNGVIEQIFKISEASFGDGFLFGGTMNANPPFTATRDAAGQITAITPNGDVNTELKKVQINESSVIQIGILANGADGLFQNTAGVDIIGNLITLRDELALGNQPTQANADQLTANLNHSISQLTANGVKQQWLETQDKRLQDVELNQAQQLDNLVGADLAAVMTELTQLQTTYQATMQMIRQSNTMSIINFI